MSLQKNLELLAANFVKNVLAALRAASLEDVAHATGQAARSVPPVTTRAKGAAKAPAKKSAVATKASGGRLARRTPADIEKTVGAIVALLRDQTAGLRAEEIRKALGLEAREMPRPLQQGLDAKVLFKKGEKRATTYFAASASASEGASGKATAKKSGGRGKKAKA